MGGEWQGSVVERFWLGVRLAGLSDLGVWLACILHVVFAVQEVTAGFRCVVQALIAQRTLRVVSCIHVSLQWFGSFSCAVQALGASGQKHFALCTLHT